MKWQLIFKHARSSESPLYRSFTVNFSKKMISLAAAAAVLASGGAQAAITVYTTQASFLAAISGPAGVDTYNDLDFTTTLATPQNRMAGSFSYVASSGPTSVFFPAGNTAADIWLATNNRTDTITFSGFDSLVNAVGGFFFRSNVSGLSTTTAATINIRVTDSTNAVVTQAQVNPAITSFVGFVSDASITQMQVWVGVQGTGTAGVWPTVNDLHIAAIPEPETYALMLAGLGLVGAYARRRRAG